MSEWRALPIYISIPCTFIELHRWHFLAQFSPSFTQLECSIVAEPLRLFREKLLRIIFRVDQIAEKSELTCRDDPISYKNSFHILKFASEFRLVSD